MGGYGYPLKCSFMTYDAKDGEGTWVERLELYFDDPDSEWELDGVMTLRHHADGKKISFNLNEGTNNPVLKEFFKFIGEQREKDPSKNDC